MFEELVNNFITTELKKDTPGTGSQSTPAVPESSQATAANQYGKETAVPGGMPAADTTAGPSGMELDSTEPAETGLPQATGAVKASAHAARLVAAATAAVPHDKPFDSIVENAGHNDSAQEKLLKLVVNSDVPPAEKMAMSAAIMARYHARTHAVSSFRSGSRSSPPKPFHGRVDDHGQIAQSWLYGVELYFDAEVTPNPVAKAVTYLQGDARYWWQQTGSGAMPPAPTFHDFKTAFLARFVKPSDSAKARSEIPTLKQTNSVEAFASHFRTVNSRITVGSPIDTTTLANFFVRGLNEKLAKALAAHCSLSIMQELDPLISAAEEMEAKLNLASKQEQPSLAAFCFVFFLGGRAIHYIYENTHATKEPQGQCLGYPVTSNGLTKQLVKGKQNVCIKANVLSQTSNMQRFHLERGKQPSCQAYPFALNYV
ncbi:hypothetical protein ABBQ32_014091 [Trebouxia sp. C0010 RCD-2024]